MVVQIKLKQLKRKPAWKTGPVFLFEFDVLERIVLREFRSFNLYGLLISRQTIRLVAYYKKYLCHYKECSGMISEF